MEKYADLGRDEKLEVFCSGCNICLTLFSKSAKWVALYEEGVATSFVCKVCVVLGRLRISLILDM
jgi:hypothetical protein